MDKVYANPLQQVNGVKFGLERKKVREILGNAKEFKKSKYSKVSADDFGYCHVFYNSKDECEAIEIFKDSTVIINGELVFPTEINQARRVIGELHEYNGIYININKSIGIYAPSGEMESILFGDSGYYEDMRI